jgi:hypothetical protein
VDEEGPVSLTHQVIESESPEFPSSKTFPIYDNIYVVEPDRLRADDIPAGLVDAFAPSFMAVEAGADAMYDRALAFVERHARRVISDRGVRVTGRTLPTGTKVIRTSGTNHRIRWVIAGNQVLHGQEIQVGRARYRHLEIPPRRYIWRGGSGEAVDVAYLLANVCAILNMHLPGPLAAVGTIADGTDEIPGSRWMMEGRRKAVADAGITDLILPAKCGFMPGRHLGVRYWPAFNTEQAIDAMFAAAAFSVTTA